MPRDGSGVYSKPAGTTAVPNTTIASGPFNSVIDDIAADLNLVRPVASGGTGGASVTSAQTALSVDNKVVYAAKSANYTALATDNNAVHRFTATATASLTAAATLGANWHYTVIADGGTVTIDPNGAETINGSATLTIQSGSSASIICDGANFFTEFKPANWEPIASQTLAAAATFDVINLSAFIKIRVIGTIFPSIASSILLVTSSNNGSSYDVGAADYSNHILSWQATTFGGSSGNANSMSLTGGVSANTNVDDAFQFELLFDNFNKASQLKTKCSAEFVAAAGSWITNTAHRRLSSVARNAFRIVAGSGTITGTVVVEGIRG